LFEFHQPASNFSKVGRWLFKMVCYLLVRFKLWKSCKTLFEFHQLAANFSKVGRPRRIIFYSATSYFMGIKNSLTITVRLFPIAFQ